MKRTLLLASAAMGLLCATATPAMAGTTADLLKRLHEKGSSPTRNIRSC